MPTSPTASTAAAQKLGFAGRIAVNSNVLTDNTLLVKSLRHRPLGDTTRADYLLDQLQNCELRVGAKGAGADSGTFRLGGTVERPHRADDESCRAASPPWRPATARRSSRPSRRSTSGSASEYGVNVDEEMARLMELQNAYAANSRVISTVQELLNRLMEVV